MNHPKYGLLRKHQERAIDIAQKLVAGALAVKIVAALVTPGGGKTLMAALFADVLLAAGYVDQVLFVVPRDTLREQVRCDFCPDGDDRGLNRFLTERRHKSGQGARQLRFGRKFAGYVVTYQELAGHAPTILRWMKGKRTLVILDECHHVTPNPSTESRDGASWHKNIAPIVEAARTVLAMSGTMARDKTSEPVSFVEYGDGAPNCLIEYTRTDGLRDQAIIRVEFKRMDARAHLERDGTNTTVDLSSAAAKLASKVLNCVLDEDASYSTDVIVRAVQEWLDYRETCQNSKSKLIVIAKTQAAARAAHRLIQSHWPNMGVELAITDEGGAARKRIFRFRNEVDSRVLVTVGMAYEGLDVKQCTHIICLSRIRSMPWLEQAFARATRFDPTCKLSWDEQIATIWVPDDPDMRRIISAIDAEQRAALTDRGPGHPPPRRAKSAFESLGAEATALSVTGDRHYSREETAIVERIDNVFPFVKAHRIEDKIELAKALGWWAA